MNSKRIIGITLATFIAGCIVSAPPRAPLPPKGGGVVSSPGSDTNRVTVQRPEGYYTRRDIDDALRRGKEQAMRDLERRSERDSRTKRDRDTCEGDRDCEEICDDIFRRRSDREDCEELTVGAVEKLEDVYEYLEDPDDDDLPSIDSADLDALISISIEPIDRLFSRFSKGEAEDVAIWIAENNDVANILEKEDDELKLFEAIFEEIGSDTLDGLEDSLTGRDNFIEIAVEENNEEALRWVHTYFEDERCDNSEESELCVLNEYCGLDLDQDPQDDLLGIEDFAEFIDDLLDEGREGDIQHPGTNVLGNIKKCPVTNEYIERTCDTRSLTSAIVTAFFTPASDCEGSTAALITAIGCESSNGLNSNEFWGGTRSGDNYEDSRDLDDWKNELCGRR